MGATILYGDFPIGEVNSTARDFLTEIDGRQTVSDIAEKLAAKYCTLTEDLIFAFYGFIISAIKSKLIYLLPEGHPFSSRITGSYEWFSPYAASIEITEACNLKCLHCYAGSGKVNPEELSTQEWFSVIDRLAKGCQKLIITGGEPLIRKDYQEIIRFAGSLGLKIKLLTNGLKVDQELAEWLVEG